MFEYKEGKTPINKLKFKISKIWRHFWNKKSLMKLYKEAIKDGSRFSFFINPEDANIYGTTEDLVSYFKYKDKTTRVNVTEYFK